MTESKIVVPTIDPVLAENFLKIQEKKQSGVSQSPNSSVPPTPNATSQGSNTNNNNNNDKVDNANANGNSKQPPSTVDLNPNDVLVEAKLPTMLEVEDANRLNQFLQSCAAGYAYLGDFGIYDPTSTLLDLISRKVDRDFELAARVYRNDIHNLNANTNEAVRQYATPWVAKQGHDQKQLQQKQNHYQNLNHYEMVKLPKMQRLVIAEYSDINFITWYWNHSGLGALESVFRRQFVHESWEQFDDLWYDPGKYRYWNRRFEDLKEQDRYDRAVNYKRHFYDYPYLPSDLEYAPPKILNRHICWDFNSPQLLGCTRPRRCRYLHHYVTGHSIKRASEYYSSANSQYDGHLARYARWIEANLHYSYYIVGLDKDEIGKLYQMNFERMKT